MLLHVTDRIAWQYRNVARAGTGGSSSGDANVHRAELLEATSTRLDVPRASEDVVSQHGRYDGLP